MHAWVEVDLDAVRANVAAIRSLLRFSVDFIAMVKGNAYGHGAVEIAKAVLAAGASHLGVAFPAEGKELRRAEIAAPILVLGSFAEEDVADLVTYRLTPSVADLSLANALACEARARGLRVPIHVEVDTGMGRLGADWRDAADQIAQLASLEGLAVEGVYTHFASADEPDRAFTQLQIRRFEQVMEALRQRGVFVPFRHYSNSAGLLQFPDAVLDAIRPGLAVYGLQPSGASPPRIRLEPALSFRSRVARVRRMDAGSFVSYGRTYKVEEPRAIATVSVGYADGYPRALSNKGAVLIRGRRFPVVGRVTMDHIMADLGPGESGVARGDRVTLLGRDGDELLTAEDLAAAAGTINYEITTRISHRAPRVYKGRM